MATALTVLYDEDCGFCTAVASRLARRDGIVTAPIGSATGDAALAGLTRDERFASFHVVDGSGRVSSAGEALAALLAVLPAGSATSRLARKFPRATEAPYGQAARHRDLLGRLFRVKACVGARSRRSRRSRSANTLERCAAICPSTSTPPNGLVEPSISGSLEPPSQTARAMESSCGASFRNNP